jgi:hypothetical protein
MTASAHRLLDTRTIRFTVDADVAAGAPKSFEIRATYYRAPGMGWIAEVRAIDASGEVEDHVWTEWMSRGERDKSFRSPYECLGEAVEFVTSTVAGEHEQAAHRPGQPSGTFFSRRVARVMRKSPSQ